MSARREPESAGLLVIVRRDHREIERMLTEVDARSGAARKRAVEELFRKLAVHETAEQEIVHPLARHAGAGAIADELVQDEALVADRLEVFEGSKVDSARFAKAFDELARVIRFHARREEMDEHPPIEANVSWFALETFGRAFCAADAVAPVAGDPPTSARAPALSVAPVRAVADLARETIRGAMQ